MQSSSDSRESNVTPLPSGAQGAPRRVPQDTREAEVTVIAFGLQNGAVMDRFDEIGLEDAHFSDRNLGALYQAMRKLHIGGRRPSVLALKDFAAASPAIDALGGYGFLVEITRTPLPIGQASDVARLVREGWIRREAIRRMDEGAEVILRGDPGVDASLVVGDVAGSLLDLADAGGSDTRGGPIGQLFGGVIDVADKAYKNDGPVGIPTGLDAVDAVLGGLFESDLVILAGRPSMGKTALATKIAVKAAEKFKEGRTESGARRRVDGARVAFFSYEMSDEQLANRVLGDLCSIPSDKIRRGEINDADFVTMTAQAATFANLQLHIEDAAGWTLSKARARLRSLERKFGKFDLAIFDYLQLITPETSNRQATRTEDVSMISRGLKKFAKETRTNVIALSQLSRSVEQREDKRPQLSDLRESGTIEQDADIVLFVYREEYYHQRAEPKRRPEEEDVKFNDRFARWEERGREIAAKADVIVGKNRHGPIATVQVGFQGAFTRFYNLEESTGA
ncbi:MAG: AAA family ATPase [Alphaproteobacteria bacterium]|nr:AAA family ATPase [Alphaproteobacteria bacterium]